jgi:hypothetical protein
MFYDNIMIIYMCYSYLAYVYIYIYNVISPCEFPKKGANILYPSSSCDMYGYVLFRMMLIWIKDSFIHMFALSLVHGCVFMFFYQEVFLIVFLIGMLCFVFSVFYWFGFYIFASSWEQLLGHVCKTTDKQTNRLTQFKHSISLYIYICYAYFMGSINNLIITKNIFSSQ